MNELALFAGAGGGILGGKLLGWRCVCAVEFEPAARRMLMARQDDGCLDPFPIWDDVRTFDGRPWRGLVDVVSGGFPCQDISAAGKSAGIEGERSGLWGEMARIIGEVRPRYVLVENSPLLVRRGLGVVLADLAALGYDARWGIVGAHHAGAPHKRDRIWIVGKLADAEELLWDGGNNHAGVSTCPEQVSEFGNGSWKETVADADRFDRRPGAGRKDWEEAGDGGGEVADTESGRLEKQRAPRLAERSKENQGREADRSLPLGWWQSEPDVGRVAHGVAARVDRLRAIGNGQVPAVVALAWRILTEDLID